MKILFVADGRSPIFLNWVDYFIRSGAEVHLASTFPCSPIPGMSSLDVITVAMSGLYAQSEVRGGSGGRFLRRILPVQLRTRIRQILAPASFPRAVRSLVALIQRINPDLVHAMRIPFEGIIASQAIERLRSCGINPPPLLISVWGNDFTLHARASSKIASYTQLALSICDALHTDCRRDLNLARDFGFSASKPAIVLPAGGGIKLDTFYPPVQGERVLDEGSPVTIINPRGFRAYVRNDTFFNAVPLVIQKHPAVRFICPGMAGEPQAQKWVSDLGIGEYVELLSPQSHGSMADLFRQSQISLSITTHDGTPNSLLEAMACGCFPIAGDLESIREWITSGVNGLLVDPSDPGALADAILSALANPELRHTARQINLKLVRERAEYSTIMAQAADFYLSLVS
jgi:glycosyltransferase involved in cell wall biosynthesis